MFCNPTLTADEFKKVHNGLCTLESLVSRLEEILHPSLHADLVKASNEIRLGMTGAYEQDQEASDHKFEIFKAFAETHNLNSIWSIYEVENFGDPHPYTNAKTLVYKDHWGDKEVVIEFQGNTWGALYKAANDCIKTSGDDHHAFIEMFKQSSINPEILFLITGS